MKIQGYRIGGLTALSRASDGDLTLLSYHPRGCLTWHWSISVSRRLDFTGVINRAPKGWRKGQWHDLYRLPFGWAIRISRQDYHKPA